MTEIYKPIAADLDAVARKMMGVVAGALEPFPREIGAFRSLGKRLRPAICLLAWRSEGIDGAAPPEVVDQAAAVELMHIATLIHDDVVDGAYQRRGHQTLHELFTDKTAVLVGDYLYATAIDIFNQHAGRPVLGAITRTTVGMAHGELMQVLLDPDCRSRRDVYLDIISKKTADFFGAAAVVGASAALTGRAGKNDQEDRLELFRRFGWNFGMAFQMIDDILDFTASEDNLGKPVFQDLVDGRITLPAILLLESGNGVPATLRTVLDQKELSQDIRAALLEDLNRFDIIPKAIRTAEGYLSEAREILQALFGSHRSVEAQQSLYSLCDYILLQRGLPAPVAGG
ncbi:polyprenyl synthetase family protein [bacterium]|nr:polyprenyl synthetase family protein [bacterium]